MKLGIVSLWWAPDWGGAEIYAYRLLVQALDAGIDAHAITTSPTSSSRVNGAAPVSRLGHLAIPIRDLDEQWLQSRCNEWNREVIAWAKGLELTHVLFNAPLNNLDETAEVYRALQQLGIRTGALQHDHGDALLAEIGRSYTATGDFEATAASVSRFLREQALAVDEGELYKMIGSPLHLRPDFIISNSEWTDRFIDPFNRAPRIVVHPFVELEATTNEPTGELARVNVSMMNPQSIKGGLLMASIIVDDRRGWSFRVLEGGWGDGFRAFIPMILEAILTRSEQIELVQYVPYMSEFYANTDVLIFPSRFEGYGMGAVEALCHGTCVVATDYPAIVEGVGEGARLVPRSGDVRDWMQAIREVLEDRPIWIQRAAERSAFLKARQQRELAALKRFLEQL